MIADQEIREIKTLILKLASNSYPRWMDIKIACKYASMSKNTLMEYVIRGDIYAKKLAGKWYFDRESLDTFMLKDGAELNREILKLCK